jgi:hypothetical protein
MGSPHTPLPETVTVPASWLTLLLSLLKDFPTILAEIEKLVGALSETPETPGTEKTVAISTSLLSELLVLIKNFPTIVADIEKLLGDV